MSYKMDGRRPFVKEAENLVPKTGTAGDQPRQSRPVRPLEEWEAGQEKRAQPMPCTVSEAG
ncbi:hypothetical protein GCM10011497_36630 [Elstera cyanobacteriorum]|nr:hypothetical protein GCM10011497_36630 [Elstera cyanobacteriorum]